MFCQYYCCTFNKLKKKKLLLITLRDHPALDMKTLDVGQEFSVSVCTFTSKVETEWRATVIQNKNETLFVSPLMSNKLITFTFFIRWRQASSKQLERCATERHETVRERPDAQNHMNETVRLEEMSSSHLNFSLVYYHTEGVVCSLIPVISVGLSLLCVFEISKGYKGTPW